MQRCGYCGGTLIETELDGDETCLFCGRTLSLVPVGLPYIKPSEWRGRKGPKPQTAPRLAAAS